MVQMSRIAALWIFVLSWVSIGLAAPTLAASDEDVEELKRRVAELEREAETQTSLPAVSGEEGPAPGEEDATGTDPRSFGSKFMPYYKYVELENELEAHILALFGMIRFSDNVAMTYELPIAKEVDYSKVAAFQNGGPTAELPPNPGGELPSGGVPFARLDADGDEMGVGDLGLRVFYKDERLRFASPFRDQGSGELMVGLETTVPTATEEVLGSDTWIVSPFFAVVVDMPFHGFIAAMNFFDFDVVKDQQRGEVGRYRGRWFYMQPLTPPDLGPLLGGWYLLPEFQPVYDWENTNFSFWVGPELGKMLAPGRIIYAKPGFGVDPDEEEREFTFELGFRWFF